MMATFDAVLIAVSVQYLVRPVEVFRDIARVLAPGGRADRRDVAPLFSDQSGARVPSVVGGGSDSPDRRVCGVGGRLRAATFDDRSPDGEDPLWIVTRERHITKKEQR